MDIELVHIDFAYQIGGKAAERAAGSGKIFDDFSYLLREGEILNVMGASGCGKTTLLKLLTGQLKPQRGRIRGIERKEISMVFQENRLCEDFSAETNVRLGCGRGYFSGCDQSDIGRHLLEVGLDEASDKKVSSFSGGMKRRVAIVRALMSESKLLLMDEPLKELDAASKEEAIAYIKKYRGNRTTVIVTHDAEEAGAFGGELLVLDKLALRYKRERQ